MKYKYSDETLSIIVKESTSMRQVCEKLGINYSGGNFAHLKKRIENASINRSHFTGQGWNKGRVHGPKRPIEDYLSNKKSILTHTLKLKLLSSNIFIHQCMKCKLYIWLNDPIPLELHHIDGDKQNNILSNLELLCPNCHAKTDNYRIRNSKSYKENHKND